MTTWAEARAAKEARQRRQRRYYTADLLGRPCSGGCGLKMPLAMLDLGFNAHPTCTAEFRALVRRG